MLRSFVTSKNSIFLAANLILIMIQVFLIFYSLPYLVQKIPFWMTSKWGLEMLAEKEILTIIPTISFSILLGSLLIVLLAKNFYQLYLDQIIRSVATISNGLLTLSLYLIIERTTTEDLFFMLSSENITMLVFLQSMILALALTPICIYFYRKINLVTDPKKHHHPGMLLKTATPRGGGMIYTIVFSTISILNTNLNPQTIAVIVACFLCGVIGLLDDIANTFSSKKFKIFGSPFFRLLVLIPIPVLILVLSEIQIKSLDLAFFGSINLTQFSINILNASIAPLALVFTALWIIWIINLLSWSNGVDGQYAGIIVISSVVVGFLALRFSNLSEIQLDHAKLAFISAGTALGILPFTWNPSKIMWGFGAISAGIVLASLSILASTKISISILVLLIPFLDAVISIIRRVINKQNPLKGDRSHLHHLLLNRGWSVKQIALFYWLSTLILGAVAYFSSEKDLPLVVLTIGGVISFIIVLLNLRLDIRK